MARNTPLCLVGLPIQLGRPISFQFSVLRLVSKMEWIDPS
jgi:hypothetical protein